MQLTCPQCHTIFEISQEVFQNEARKVECSVCQNIWLANTRNSNLLNNKTNIVSELKGENANQSFSNLKSFLKEPTQQENSIEQFFTESEEIEKQSENNNQTSAIWLVLSIIIVIAGIIAGGHWLIIQFQEQLLEYFQNMPTIKNLINMILEL